MKKLLDELNAMPGPVWVFGTYAVYQMWFWVADNFNRLAGFRLSQAWTDVAFCIGGFIAAAQPLLFFWLMLRRSRYAVSLVSWYAGLRAVASLIILFSPLYYGVSNLWYMLSAGFSSLMWCVLWFGLLRYMERSAVIAEFFPVEQRKNLWWTALPMIVLILLYGY